MPLASPREWTCPNSGTSYALDASECTCCQPPVQRPPADSPGKQNTKDEYKTKPVAVIRIR